MAVIKRKENKIHVDVDGPSPLPEIARWLKDYEPPRREVRIFASALLFSASLFDDSVGQLLSGLDFVVEVLVYYCSGLEIALTKYATATATASAAASASATVIKN